MIRGLLLCACVATLGVAPASATPEDAERLYEQATDAIGENKFAEAAELLEKAARTPDAGRIGPEALFLLGELYEEQLDKPGQAVAAYREIRARHPNSRVAVAAGRRLLDLEQMLGGKSGDADRLGRFLAIRRQEGDSDPTDSLSAAEALLAEDPEWISAARVRLWMAGVALRDGQRKRAEELYVEALGSSDPDIVFEARLAASKLARERGAYQRAREIAGAIDPGGVPGRIVARTDELENIDKAEARAGLAVYALIWLIALPIICLGIIAWRRRGLRKFLAALWPPPAEAIYLAPILAVFVIASFTGHIGISGAVIIVSVAGLAISYLAGAAHRTLPRSWPISIGFALGTALGVAAAFYVSLLRNGLVDLIIATVRFGPDV